MKKIVVISDSHGNKKALNQIYPIMEESDYVFHLGDNYKDMDEYMPSISKKLYRVHGNCDYGREKEVVVEIEKVKIFATHGDLYGAKYGLQKIVERAKELGANLVLYGHTHRSEIVDVDGIKIINPGTLTYLSAEKSFCYLVLNGEKITAVINDRSVSDGI